MNQIEILLLKTNLFSWFLTKYLPIFLILLVTFLVAFRLYNRSNKQRLIKILTLISTSLLPVSIYIYCYPVYTGDIFESGSEVKTALQFPKEKTLTIFVLPDCPYCHETIHLAKLLTARNSALKVQFLITGSQSDKAFEMVKSKQVAVRINPEIDNTISLTKGIFPTYVISENNKAIKSWTNNEFGVVALDEIEGFNK